MTRDHVTRDHLTRDREDLCYLKSGRGYLRNRTDGFVSGATFRDGCNEDPYCDSPYSHYGHQCLLFSHDYWDASIADVRRNINNTRGETTGITFIIPMSNNICSDIKSTNSPVQRCAPSWAGSCPTTTRATPPCLATDTATSGTGWATARTRPGTKLSGYHISTQSSTSPPQVLGVPTLQVAGGGPGLPLLHAALLRLPAPPRLPPAAAEREAAGLQAEDGLLRRHGARAGGRAAEAENRLQKQCIRWQRVQFAGKIEPLLELALNLNIY